MTRAQHWKRAQDLLTKVEDRSAGGALLARDRDDVALAQAHATLAAAPADVAREREPIPGRVLPQNQSPTQDRELGR